MKILFVCMQYIHSARWINQLKDSHHEIFVFDCLDKPIHEDLNWTNTISNWKKRKRAYVKGEYFLQQRFPLFYERIRHKFEVTASEKLIELISEIKPDLVHSLEMQSETYPLLKVRQSINFNWAYSSWGSDIYLYQNKKGHRKLMNKIFTHLNFLFTDNNRDVKLSRDLSFKNKNFGPFPGGGGYNLNSLLPWVKPLEKRKLILVKGYHHWAGRSLQVLKALEDIVEFWKDSYSIYVYSAHKVVEEKILEMNKTYQTHIEYSSRYDQLTHEQLLNKFGNARIAIANNISDGIPNTLLETIIMGGFPIQSNPGGVSEDYIKHGDNGYLIEDPNDVKNISKLILDALNNENLLKSAYKKNTEISKNLEYDRIKLKVLEAYNQIQADL